MKTQFTKRLFPILILAGTAIFTTPSQASLLGDSVTGDLTQGPNTGVSVTSDFASPAIVGAGVEFTTTVDDVFGKTWVIDVDLGSDNFTVNFTSGSGNANIFSATSEPFFTIDLGDLDWNGGPGGITDVALASFSGVPIWGDGHSALTFTTNSISVAFISLENGASYVFDINNSVPEPASLALMGLGLVGLGVSRRKTKSLH